MLIRLLTLIHFKNHEQRRFELSPKINCFVGNNGVGKTNVLDALHYLSVGKSFLGNSDQNNIEYGQSFFTIEATVDNGEKEDILKVQQQDTRKTIKKNDKIYDRLSDHIGFLPSVIISPYDQNLISDAAESRRRFLDGMICQTDSDYLYHLIRYQKAVRQRNALLKTFARNRFFEAETIAPYDKILCESGNEIYIKRKGFNELFNPIVQRFYTLISEGREEITLDYVSDLQETNFAELLTQNLDKDCVLTYTSRGIHKDDLIFMMHDALLKKTGSQGQQKPF